jgi:hypothetical protein
VKKRKINFDLIFTIKNEGVYKHETISILSFHIIYCTHPSTHQCILAVPRQHNLRVYNSKRYDLPTNEMPHVPNYIYNYRYKIHHRDNTHVHMAYSPRPILPKRWRAPMYKTRYHICS